MTETTNQTAKYSKNYSGDVGETPKPMTGTWHLEAPDGRRWAGSGPLNCVAQEISERVPLQVQLARVLAIADEPDLDERHTKLGVEYDTVKVDELVDKLYAEIEALRAKLDELEKQEPVAFVNEQGFIIERDDMQISSGEKLYLAAGARPVREVPAAKPVEAQQPGMAPATLPDERATFEAWISKDGGDLSTFGSGRNIHYSNSAVNNAWTGWKARASHWQAPAQPAPAAVVGPSEVHEAIRNVQAQYLALTKAAVNLVTAVDDRHDHHEAPLRYTIPYGAVTALREAITAAPQPAPAGEYPAGAIVNGRAHIERLESTYQFECEAGPLSNCKDWQGLKRCFEYLIGRIDADRAMRAAQPAPGAGDQVQMILKHRLIRKVEGDWLAASEFMTGEPDPSWLAKTEESPEEWRIEQARRVSGEQIQAGLTRAFASWKKPAPAAVVGPSDCLAGSGGWQSHAEMMERERDYWRIRAQMKHEHQRGDCWYWQSDGNDHLDSMVDSLPVVIRADSLRALIAAAPATQPAPAAQDDAKDAARYRWLTDDHERQATRIVRNAICERLPVMSYSAASANIDAARAADKKEPT